MPTSSHVKGGGAKDGVVGEEFYDTQPGTSSPCDLRGDNDEEMDVGPSGGQESAVGREQYEEETLEKQMEEESSSDEERSINGEDGAEDEDQQGRFDRSSGLPSKKLRTPEGISLHSDIDASGLFMRRFAIRDGMAATVQWVAREATISKRSVLYGEKGKGKDFNALLLGKLRGKQQWSLKIVWKRSSSEGVPSPLGVEEAKKAYTCAVKVAIESLLSNDELEQSLSLSTVLAFSPDHPIRGVEDQDLPARAGNAILRAIYREFRNVVEAAFANVRFGIYAEIYGEKEPLTANAEELDQWFSLRHCEWVTLAIATVARGGRNTTLVCTKKLGCLMRYGGGSLAIYSVMAHPHLANAVWKRRDDTNVCDVGYEMDIGATDDSFLGITMMRTVVYLESNHCLWAMKPVSVEACRRRSGRSEDGGSARHPVGSSKRLFGPRYVRRYYRDSYRPSLARGPRVCRNPS